MTQAYNLAILANAVNTSGQLNVGTNATGTLPVANGGTGQSALTANNVVLGNGTSGVQFVAPSTNGNVLTSNGTTWVSQAPSSGGVTSLNGQTGAITNTNLDAIGSVVAAIYAVTIPNQGNFAEFLLSVNVNTTLSGSDLRYNFTNNYLVGLPGGSYSRQVSGDLNSVGYAGGGSSLSGTWRVMGNPTRKWSTGDGASNGWWMTGLFVRVS